MSQRQENQDNPLPGTITDEHIEKLRDSSYDENGRNTAKWWLQLATKYKDAKIGDKAMRRMKEAILLDFLAWGILASFILGISFSTVGEKKIKIKETIIEDDQVLYWVTSTLKNVDTVDWLLFLKDTDYYFDTKLKFSIFWGQLLEAFSLKPNELLEFFYIIFLMSAGTNSLRSACAGIFKYLYFLPIPSTEIIEACITFNKKHLNQKAFSVGPGRGHESDHMLLRFLRFFSMEKIFLQTYNFFIPNMFDHQTPVRHSMYSLIIVAGFSVFLNYGILAAVIPIYFAFTLINDTLEQNRIVFQIVEESYTKVPEHKDEMVEVKEKQNRASSPIRHFSSSSLPSSTAPSRRRGKSQARKS